ncbi:NADH:flavin oxidoreductase [Shewanella maritima]|uniref:NADH:flavin oxidoreductase n=1 Tax=Shewanella maritima TaxID=2520507 RepID=UPI0037362EFC
MNRFTPLIVNGLCFANRLVVAPMASQTADLAGIATATTVAHYQKLALSQAALVMVEYSFVSLSGRSESHQLGAHIDECVAGLAQIATTIHDSGALAALQLTHCGGKAQLDQTPDLMGPSGITVPAYDRVLPQPRTMSLADIEQWQQDFVAAAMRAQQAGFDLVELHCAHGYGLNQFLSPLTNQRDDQYGGDQVNRSRIVSEIVAQIKAKTSLRVTVRIPGQDFYPQGLSRADMLQTSRILIEAGVDMLNISSGIGGWNRPKEKRGEGYLIDEAAHINQAELGVPVIGVGGIETAEYIEQALSNNWCDFTAVGRAILSNPAGFADRVMS